MHTRFLLTLSCLVLQINSHAAWESKEVKGGTQVSRDGKPVARLVYGENELKPYLDVYGPSGELLTEWSAQQRFPHHRGIFIGWNRIRSDLGSSDLWHLNKGEKMILREVKVNSSATNAVIRAQIEWHASKTNSAGNTLLIREDRILAISQNAGQTQIDAQFTLRAARNLTLDGDLQHAGIHFRASKEVGDREKETKYVWEPDIPGPGGKVPSTELKWCRLIFPIGTNWYTATELNSPENPVEELSWRGYGRFGFFFKKELRADEPFTVNYRFLTEQLASPVRDDELPAQRKAAEAAYESFAAARYETRSNHDPNGIGKFYMGREIAHVMGHQAADWLERPEREEEEQSSRMVNLLALKDGDIVADIGAGTGYISRLLSAKVGAAGKVYAVDIQQEMLDLLAVDSKRRGINNILPVLGTVNDPKLPRSSVDLAIMVDVYHELEQPAEMLRNIKAALKPGGRIAFVEFRAEDPRVPIKAVHKMTETQVKAEASAAGLAWDKTISDLPWQHLILMRKAP